MYGPVAAAPPEQEAVGISVLGCVRVAGSAPVLLDLARDEDAARWPGEVVREDAASRRTYAARCALAEAQDVLDGPGPGGGPVPVPTAEQGAAMELVSAGDDVAACWRDDPQEAVALVLELTVGGELGVDEVLDAAVDAEVVCGLLVLDQAGAAAMSDPSTAAELCLSAAPYFARAVALAGVDLD